MLIIRPWVHAIRPRTLPLAVASIFLGSAAAWHEQSFRWPVFCLSLATALFLQILSNLANDLGDFLKGADNSARVGQKRTLQAGMVSLGEMRAAIFLTAAVCLVSGSGLILTAIPKTQRLLGLLFAGLGAAAIGAALKYTLGRAPYGYAGFGDVAVFFFFGWVGVAGSFYLHGQTFSSAILLPATSAGCLAASVLNINNMRDIDSDRRAGKKTVAARLGATKSKFYHLGLMVCAFAAIAIFLVRDQTAAHIDGVVLGGLALLFILLLVRMFRAQAPRQMEPLLKAQSLLSLLFALVTGIVINLP